MSSLRKKLARLGNDLTYVMCEDWFIYARDNDGNMYYLNTELWPQWEEIAKQKGVDIADVWDEPNAVEDYMLPIAKRTWNNQNWRKAEGFTAEDLTSSQN